MADAFAAATAYVQPSTNESFSRTIMESWLAGTPVLAAAGSEVLRWHCDRSGGGLTFADEFELAQCLSFLAAAPDDAARLAKAGREYVLANYRWERRARRDGEERAGADVRILVVGSYPPPAHGEANRTVATVHRLGAQGDDVEVLSRRGSAAQYRGQISGPLGALLVWWRGRHYDAVVVQIESGWPAARLARPSRAVSTDVVDCLSWGLALRAVRSVTMVVPDTDVVPRSVGGRSGRFLWTAADHLLVAERARPPPPRRRGRRARGPDRAPRGHRRPPSRTAADAGWADVSDAAAVMERVQRRAAEDRRAARARHARRRRVGPGSRESCASS